MVVSRHGLRQWVLLAGLVWLAGCRAREEAVAPTPPPEGRDEEFVVEVHGQRLTRREADLLAAREAHVQGWGEWPADRADAARERFHVELVDTFIAEHLLMEAADRLAAVADPADVQATVDRLRSSLPPGRTLEAALHEQGLTEDTLRDELTYQPQLRIARLLREQAPVATNVTADEVRDWHAAHPGRYRMPEMARVRELALLCPPGDPQEPVMAERMATIRQSVVDGADWAATAREHSGGPSARMGGELGRITREVAEDIFGAVWAEAAFGQDVGVIGPVLRSELGYHVLQVHERLPAADIPVEALQGRIADDIRAERARAAREGYLKALRAQATIRFGLEPTAARP